MLNFNKEILLNAHGNFQFKLITSSKTEKCLPLTKMLEFFISSKFLSIELYAKEFGFD